MSFDAHRFTPRANHPETLAQCLRAICIGHERKWSYNDACCALGTAVMVSLRANAPAALRWNVFGRHAFVEEAARELGVELRPLHPPQAAPAPPAPSEFELHWRDSYMPLVHASIERSEPVLAWMGWPQPHGADWGVITSVDGDGTARGITPGCGNEPVRLAGPPVQVYCATAFDMQGTRRHSQLESILRRFGRVLRNELPEAFGVVTGVPALKALGDASSAQDVHFVMNRMVSDRASVGEVLLKFASDADPRWRSRAERIAEAINQQTSFATRIDPSRITHELDKLIEIEATIADLLP